MSLQVRARVTVTLELALPDTWNEDAKFDQVEKQAREKAISMLERVCKEAHLTVRDAPTVTVVIVEKTP